jgi:cell pole-organizing protein PopZ
MSDSSTQEPTMEEILASIRRIISEDDAPAAEAAPAEAAPPPPPPPEPELEVEEDDVLELTEPVQPPPAAPAPAPPPVFAAMATEASSQVMGDLDISFPPGPAAPPPKPAAPPAPAPVFEAYTPPPPEPAYTPEASYDQDEPLLSNPSASRAAAHFGALGSLGRHVPMPVEGRTLEHLVAELLRPVLKDWLDQHLPSIVEAKVQAEIERVSRQR